MEVMLVWWTLLLRGWCTALLDMPTPRSQGGSACKELRTSFRELREHSVQADVEDDGVFLEKESEAPARFLESLESIESLYGTALPTAWEHFPHLSASPLAEGPALLELRFRPFTTSTATVSLRGPESIRFFCQNLLLIPLLALPQCSTHNSSLQISLREESKFSESQTYLLQIDVQHLPGSWRPDEDQQEVLLRPAGVTEALWWLSFDDAAGRILAFTERLPGYPVWPVALDVGLDFVSLPLAPLPPGSPSLLALTFRLPEDLSGTISNVLRLYAPLGYSFNCSLEAPQALLALGEEVLPIQNASCVAAQGSDIQERLVLQLPAARVLEADVNYSFTVAVNLPTELAATATEEATRWYFSVQAFEAALGGAESQPWPLQDLALSLRVPAASPGSAAPLQTALKLNQLLSSPKEGNSLACIELVAGEGYAFTSTCGAENGIAPSEAGQNLPAGCSCAISDGIASICLPNGAYLLADVWYHFVVYSVLLPAGLGRRLASASSWSARAVTARGKEVSRYLTGTSTASVLTAVPRLEIFAFTSAGTAAETRRLGALYIVAFAFKAAETTATAAVRLLLTAPEGFHFPASQDCSPDSSAALLPLPVAPEAAFSGGRVLPVGWCTATQRTSEQQLLTASDMPAAESETFPSALLGLGKPLVDFRFRYLFRVAVQHPLLQPTHGVNIWVLSLLDNRWSTVAQRGDLNSYELIGDLALSVEPSSRLLSSPGRVEESNLTVQFQLSVALPEGGEVVLRLAPGFAFPPVRHFATPGSPMELEENVNETTTTATSTTVTRTGAPLVRCSVYLDGNSVNPVTLLSATCDAQVGELRLATSRLQAGVSYNFRVAVANPENPQEANASRPFELQTFAAGEPLDAGSAPGFAFAAGRLPFLALRTEPARPLGDRAAAVLVMFGSDTPLWASWELRLRAPVSFLLPENGTCEHFDAAQKEGRSALPTALLAALSRAWAEVQGEAPWPQLAIPLPPFAGCSLALGASGPEVRVSLPGALRGQRSYVFAVTAQSPIVEPPSEQNIWQLEVWAKSVATTKLLYVGDGQGFPLVPKLQDTTLYPFRALGDAYLTQSFLLPQGASLVSLRVEFAIPFETGSLGERLEVTVEAPEGFALGSAGSCEVRSLQLGRDVVPESWYQCAAPSPLTLLLSSKVPPLSELASIGNLLTYKAEIFPALPPVDAEGAESRLWNLRAFACRLNAGTLEDSDVAWKEASLCALLAASTGIPSWTMSGYLHVDQLIVSDARSVGPESVLGQWLQQQTPSRESSQLLSLTIRGIRLNSALPAGSEIRLLAPSGYSFRQPFDASQVLSGPALDLSRSRTEEQLMVLVFQGDLSGDDGALDLVVVAEALAITAEGTGTTPWKLETRSVTGRVLGVQGDLGSFDQLAAFDFLVVTATTAAAGAVFDLAVFFAMPAHFDLPGGSLLRLRAPLGAAFATGATGLELPTAAAGRLRDPRLASVRPMPPKTSCLASADTLTITLDLDGLTQGATYAFQWPAQRVVGQEASWRPLTAAGATGHFADLLLADEVASAPRLGSWSLEALRAGKRLLKSEVFATGLEMKSLSPVWLLPMRPFYGQECLVFVVFSLGGFAFAPTARLRLKLQSGQAGATERLRFLSCERQEALLRQGAWAQPLAFGTEAFVASQTGGSLAGDSALATVAFENCVLGQGALQSNESSMRSFEELQSSWLSATGLEMTLDLQTQLDPASEQYLLVIALLNPPRSSGVAEDQMIIEVIDGSGEGERAAARSPDLRTYALASEMKLTHWSHSTSYTSAWNQLILEFQPVTVLSDRQAEAVGFLLLAPPTFVFTEKSCEDLVLQRTLMSEDLQTGELTSRPLFLEERPGCEVVSSEWLREGGYYQHQLTIFLPPLVGFRTDLRYRLEVAVRNPPLPLGADLLKRALRDKTSPKFSTSPFLVAALNVWRICTFVWAAGDTGKGDVPFAVGRGMAAFGRLGGISKVDEVAWKGFDVVVNT